MKQSRCALFSLLLSALLAMDVHAQTVSIAGSKIHLANGSSAINLSVEFAALRHAMREQTSSATVIIHSADGRISLRSMPTTLARADRR